MNAVNTRAIVLRRVNYSEADRIITFITPDQGKITAIAKSVRKSKSKLAGGIELFSVSEISFIVGKRDISTLISTRLESHYGNIVKQLSRTNVAYDAICKINKATEEKPEADYFHLLHSALKSLDDLEQDEQVVGLWFDMQLLKLAGHMPNLKTDTDGNKLQSGKTYDFHLDEMAFISPASRQGNYSTDHIKFLRLGFSAGDANILQRISGAGGFISVVGPLVQGMLRSFVRI